MNALTDFFANHRIALVLTTVLLAIFIAGGAWYVEHEPALSMRAFIAKFERYAFAFQFASAEVMPTPQGNASAIPVLTYHRIISDSTDINNVTKSRFKDHMVALKKAGWSTVSLAEFEAFMRGERTLPAKSFMITFDDGTKDSFYPVDPILEVLGFEAVNFIIVQSSEIPRTVYYLNPREIERMLALGRWSIGSHSYDGHRPYAVDAGGKTGIFFADRIWNNENRLDTPAEFTARIRDDLQRSKKELEEKYGVPIRSFAFPLGNETGINGANNFSEGASITQQEAEAIYDLGYLQLSNQHYTTNFPRTLLTSMPSAADDFIVRRIHVDYDWDGARVLEILENGFAKPIPYEDDFSTDKGWIPAWGNLELGRNNFQLVANEDSTSASTFLDGSALWDNYSFDAALSWQTGHVIMLADVLRSDTYHSCVFSPGAVRIQSTVDGVAQTVAEAQNPDIAFGNNVRVGIRVRGSVIECAWNFNAVAESYTRTFTGGIGIQTWSEQPGTAAIRVSSVIVRPISSATTTPQ